MRTLPILFSTSMVKANLEDRKNQTRRLSGLDSINKDRIWKWEFQQMGNSYENDFEPDGNIYAHFKASGSYDVWASVKCPYGAKGNILWCRETWALPVDDEGNDPGYQFKADYYNDNSNWWKWQPSIFMPREACRMFLEVVSIGVERVADISEKDAINEGIESWVEERMRSKPIHYKVYHHEPGDESTYSSCPIVSYQTLWDSINNKPKPVYKNKKIVSYEVYPFDQDSAKPYEGKATWKGKPLYVTVNPWVWVIKYKKVSKPENF